MTLISRKSFLESADEESLIYIEIIDAPPLKNCHCAKSAFAKVGGLSGTLFQLFDSCPLPADSLFVYHSYRFIHFIYADGRKKHS